MIITHTTNAEGLRRVYLGGKSSIEGWIEPAADGITWTFHIEKSPSSYPLPADEFRAWANYMLLALADALDASPADLQAVPFERIAALHSANPAEYRRMAVPRRQKVEHGYMATAPHITRPQADYTARDSKSARWQR